MTKRAGSTVKLSISLDQRDLELLRKRAKRLSGGNVSAAITDMIHIAREWEGREALAAWLGQGRDEPTKEKMDAIRAEWVPLPPRGPASYTPSRGKRTRHAKRQAKTA
jgi:hypothetical protein